MKIKTLCKTLITLSALTLALNIQAKESDNEKERMEILAKYGLPLPGSGIKVIPRSMLNLPQEVIDKGNKEKQEAQSNGYVKRYNNLPRELLSVTPELVKKQLSASLTRNMDSYTGFKSSVDQFKLAFNFPTVSKNKTLSSSNMQVKVIAATPMGGFHKNKGGWSGAAEYFNIEGIGACSYSVMNVKASNSAARLAQEDVTYTVNNKATLLRNVEGSDSSGYLYSVKWFDDTNFHELECANMHYSNDINNLVIELAKKIDSN